MILQVGVENNNEGRSIAWALEHPGCFAYGVNEHAACLNLETAIQVYATWILRHDTNTWLNFDEVDIQPEETWETYCINENMDKVEGDGYSVDSFFRHDWKPLTREEIGHAIKMLSWSRSDLERVITGLSVEKLDATYVAERWSINGILAHIGGAEWWYFDRLGLAFPKEKVSKDPMTRLKQTREMTCSLLPKLEGSTKVVGVDGEFWSPRKLLRRSLWHELDHIKHIQQLT